jgi:hypothetical protein
MVLQVDRSIISIFTDESMGSLSLLLCFALAGDVPVSNRELHLLHGRSTVIWVFDVPRSAERCKCCCSENTGLFFGSKEDI